MTKNKQQFYLIAHHINNEEIPTTMEYNKYSRRFVTGATRRVSLVEQELLILL